MMLAVAKKRNEAILLKKKLPPEFQKNLTEMSGIKQRSLLEKRGRGVWQQDPGPKVGP